MELLQFLQTSWFVFVNLIVEIWHMGPAQVALKFIPFVLFFELPVQASMMFGVFLWAGKRRERIPMDIPSYPKVSCIILCHSEGRDVISTIRSLTEQIYPGPIELVAVIDGSIRNQETYAAVQSCQTYVKAQPQRSMRILPKRQRGGRVSSINLGLACASGEIVMVLDGDTSFDNDMVSNAVSHFQDPNVVAVSGNLRVRNARKSIATRLQAIEYMLSIHASRIALDQFNAVNNVSGAFGVFRRSFVEHIGGWDSGTAEDLDMTIRIKKYFSRHPELRIRFEPYAIGHTDVPDTVWGFFNQRLRWDGDLFYVYFRKYRDALRPGLLGWPNFIAIMWTGVFFQILLPLGIIFYTTYIFLVYPAAFVVGVLIFIYFFYLFLTVIFYIEYLLLVSERPRQDFELAWVLPFYPLLTFASRIWSGVATLSEIFMRSHLDSSMAPWWVLKKTKF